MRTSKSRLRLETKFLIEHATSSIHGSIHLLIEKDFVWLMRQDIWLLIYPSPNLVWPLKKKKNERSTRIESCKAYSLTRNCTTLNLPLLLHPICERLKAVSRNTVIINQPTAQPSVFHRTKFGVIFTLYSLLANTLQQQVRIWVHCAEEEIKYEMSVMWNSIKKETTQQYCSYLCKYVCLVLFGANYN